MIPFRHPYYFHGWLVYRKQLWDVLAGLVHAGLTDPVVGPLADIVIPPAIKEEVGTVFASTHSMPMPVVWLAWPPIPRGEDTSKVGRSGGTESRPGKMGLWIRSSRNGAERERQAQKARVHSLEVGLIFCSIHPFPDSFRITEAHPGVWEA